MASLPKHFFVTPKDFPLKERRRVTQLTVILDYPIDRKSSGSGRKEKITGEIFITDTSQNHAVAIGPRRERCSKVVKGSPYGFGHQVDVIPFFRRWCSLTPGVLRIGSGGHSVAAHFHRRP